LSSTVTVDASGAGALDDWAGDCVLPGAGVVCEPQPARARAALRARAAGARVLLICMRVSICAGARCPDGAV
jgi:hypothetical protein